MSSPQKNRPASKASQKDAQDSLEFLTSGAAGDKASHGLRYSKFVRAMKLGLPLGAVLLLGAILLWPQIQKESNRFQVGISGLDPRHPNRLKVINARFRGVTSDGRPYSLVAESAFEAPNANSGGTKAITLEAPSADMLQTDGTWILANAPEGSYDQKSQLLKLRGGVTVFQDSGYTFSSKTAEIHLHNGYAFGNDPASAFGPGGEIESEDGFEIIDKGRHILFKGKSKLILRPGDSFDVSGS